MYVFKDKKVRNDVLRKGGNQMKIIVTPEEMRSNATNIRTEKANFEQCISSMRTIVNSMSLQQLMYQILNATMVSLRLLENFWKALHRSWIQLPILWKKLTGDLLHLWDSKKRQFVRGYVLAQRCAETEMSDEKKIVIKAEQEKDTAQENTNPALLMKTPAMPLKMEFAEKITKEPEVKIKKANS